MLGKDRPFEFEWISIYGFHCRRLETVLARAGDLRRRCRPPGLALRSSGLQQWRAGHRQSGLEARCGTGGRSTQRPTRDLRYSSAEAAAEENILNSTRSTDFITPQVARLADHSRCRPVADGRGAVRPAADQLRPAVDTHGLRHAALDPGHRAIGARPAWAAPCRMRRCAARRQRGMALEPAGAPFTLIYCGDELPCALPAHVELLRIGQDVQDEAGLFQQRYDARPARPSWCGRTSICAPAFAGSSRRR